MSYLLNKLADMIAARVAALLLPEMNKMDAELQKLLDETGNTTTQVKRIATDQATILADLEAALSAPGETIDDAKVDDALAALKSSNQTLSEAADAMEAAHAKITSTASTIGGASSGNDTIVGDGGSASIGGGSEAGALGAGDTVGGLNPGNGASGGVPGAAIVKDPSPPV